VEVVSHIVDFQQCIQNCNVNNQTSDKNCKLDCYIDFGSLGYRNSFSSGVAPDKLMLDINKQVKAFKIPDVSDSNDVNSNDIKLNSIYNNAQSLIKSMNQKYIKTDVDYNDNAPLTRQNLLELFEDDKYLYDAFNYISNSTYSTLKQLTKSINENNQASSNIINTLLYTSLNNNYGDLIHKFTKNISGNITKNIIQNARTNFSKDKCITKCNLSTEHLSSVFSGAEQEFNEKVIDDNSINEIHEHCLNQCDFINEVYELYGNMDTNEINNTYKMKRSMDKNKFNRSNELCNNKIICKKNQNDVMVCNYSDNTPFFNRIDGCSIPGMVNWSFAYDKTILLPACNGHDACYHCNPVDSDPSSTNESLGTEEYLSCNNKLRQNGEKLCNNYNFGSSFDTIKGKVKCLQEVESMVLAVDVAGWKSYTGDRNVVNSDTTHCICNRGVREISAQNFLINK
jgi:hypothetical protein